MRPTGQHVDECMHHMCGAANHQACGVTLPAPPSCFFFHIWNATPPTTITPATAPPIAAPAPLLESFLITAALVAFPISKLVKAASSMTTVGSAALMAVFSSDLNVAAKLVSF